MSDFNQDVGDRIRLCRTSMGMTMKELGTSVGLSEGNIQRYEKGKIKNVDANLLIKIADVLDVSPAYLMGWRTVDRGYCNYRLYPTSVSAGQLADIEAVTDFIEITVADIIMGRYAGKKGIIILKINGESMNKVIPNGSFIVVDTNITHVSQIKDSDIVVFSEYGSYSVKRFYHDEKRRRFLFKPDSTDECYTPIIIEYSQAENTRIIGKVVNYMVSID